MKKMALAAFVMLLSLTTISAIADDKKALLARIESMNAEQKEARISEMKARVYEIKEMDKSALSKTERKELRRELKELNTEARAWEGKGVYLSLGAIIIIILLLILIL